MQQVKNLILGFLMFESYDYSFTCSGFFQYPYILCLITHLSMSSSHIKADIYVFAVFI